MVVLEIWRYPVKAMLGERVEAAEIGAGGLEGDRRWVVADAATGERIASKHGPTDPRLRACRAQIQDGRLAVTLPDGTTTTAVAEALSELLERRVTLDEYEGGGDRFARTGGHHDFAPVHLVTTRALADMRAIAPGTVWDARRFRPNLVLDDAPGDDDLLGRELRAPSGLRLAVGIPTPRCVVPTRAHEELPADPSLLKTLVREREWDLGPFGRREGCLGTYAEVTASGRIALGDRLTAGDRSAPTPEAAVAATLDRVVAGLAEA